MTNISKKDENYYVRGFIALGKLEMGQYRGDRSPRGEILVDIEYVSVVVIGAWDSLVYS